MENNLKLFVQECLTEMMCKGVSIYIEHKSKIFYEAGGERTYCSGYFDENPLSFHLATGKPQKEWAPIFLHEYGHFEQWKEGNAAYKALDDCEPFDRWVNHDIELDDKTIQLYVRTIQACELDCERRVVSYIKNKNLKMDTQAYIKRANSYVLFYNMVAETRLWYRLPPYSIPQVLECVPGTFLRSYNKYPPGYQEAIKKYCLQKS